MITPNALAYALINTSAHAETSSVVELALTVDEVVETKAVAKVEAKLVEIIAEREDIEDLASLPIADAIELVEAYRA